MFIDVINNAMDLLSSTTSYIIALLGMKTTNSKDLRLWLYVALHIGGSYMHPSYLHLIRRPKRTDDKAARLEST